jgi:hypothetical protein
MDMKYAKQTQNYMTFWFDVTRKIKVSMSWKYYIVSPGNRPAIHEVA